MRLEIRIKRMMPREEPILFSYLWDVQSLTECFIGRDPARNAIVLEQPIVAKRHTVLFFSHGVVFARDLNCGAGTLVRSAFSEDRIFAKIASPYRIQPFRLGREGDTLLIGSHFLQIWENESRFL